MEKHPLYGNYFMFICWKEPGKGGFEDTGKARDDIPLRCLLTVGKDWTQSIMGKTGLEDSSPPGEGNRGRETCGHGLCRE